MKFFQAVTKFSIKKVNKTAAQFNMEKLKWTNAQYIKTSSVEKITDLLIPMLKEEIEQVRGMIQAAVGVAKAELRADFESKLDDLKDESAKLKTSKKEVKNGEL